MGDWAGLLGCGEKSRDQAGFGQCAGNKQAAQSGEGADLGHERDQVAHGKRGAGQVGWLAGPKESE